MIQPIHTLLQRSHTSGSLAGGRLAAALAFVGLVALAPMAQAAVYYLTPGGNDANAGTSLPTAWATIARANSALRAGDVVNIAPGTYSSSIKPTSSGSLNARITFVGNLANPSAVIVPDIFLSTNYITVKGVTANASARLEYPARYDSVAYCHLGGAAFSGSKYSMIAHNTIVNTIRFSQDALQAMGGISNPQQDTLRGNIINMGVIPTSHAFKIHGFAQYCLIDSNRVTGTFTSASIDGVGRIFYNSSYNTLRDNSWVFEATYPFGGSASGDPWNGYVLRDSSSHYTFERDTVLLGMNSPYGIRGQMAGSGSYPNSCTDNLWTECVYKTNAYIYHENKWTRYTIQNSVFASKDSWALWWLGTVDGGALKHNVFYSGKQAVRLDGDITSPVEITSNIFYSPGATIANVNHGGIAQYGGSSGAMMSQNYNLFFTPTYTNTPGDRSVMWCCYTGSKVGPSTPWFNYSGDDANSKMASPRFADSTFAGLDAHLLSGSNAIGAGIGGSDAGPFPFVSAGPDVTPPAAVVNLSASLVSDQVVVLNWTAPGDDGNSGRATAYDLRWYTQPITSANFDVTLVVPVQPVPQLAGSAESYVMVGMLPSSTYYFALRTRDEAGNWSGLSNVLVRTTTATDLASPSAIRDLSATP